LFNLRIYRAILSNLELKKQRQQHFFTITKKLIEIDEETREGRVKMTNIFIVEGLGFGESGTRRLARHLWKATAIGKMKP
jgi:hypothetical protein